MLADFVSLVSLTMQFRKQAQAQAMSVTVQQSKCDVRLAPPTFCVFANKSRLPEPRRNCPHGM